MNLLHVAMLSAGAVYYTDRNNCDHLYFPAGLINPEHLPNEYTVSSDGTKTKFWLKDGVRHRNRGPAYIREGKQYYNAIWFQDGKMHRENKPAFCSPTIIAYYSRHVLHRFGGAAEYCLVEDDGLPRIKSTYCVWGKVLSVVWDEISVEQFQALKQEALIY